MPIPGSKLNTVIDVVEVNRLTPYLYPDRADFLKKFSTRDSTGQEVHTFAPWPQPNPIGDIPCRLAPIILIRPEPQDERTQAVEIKNARYHLDLVKNPTDVEVGWQVTVRVLGPGITKTYQIFGVETDGNSLTARYLVGDIEPFNA